MGLVIGHASMSLVIGHASMSLAGASPATTFLNL
jgi:hypothetical protein